MRKFLLSVLVLSLMLPFASGCAGGGTKNELRLAVLEDAKNLNPYMGYGGTETEIIGMVYDTLLGWDDAKAQLTPGLADKWDIKTTTAPAGIVTFTLNSSAKWHDGKPVTAQDVEYCFNMIIKQRFPGMMAILGSLKSVKATDAQHVEIEMTSVTPGNLRFLGTAPCILPKHVWETIQDPKTYANTDPAKAIGSGPYKLKEKQDGQFITLEKAGKHYRATYTPQTIRFQVVRDETVGIMSLQKGELDALMWNVDAAVAQDVQKNPSKYPNIAVSKAPSTSVTTLMFNLRKAPYSDVKFREAISKAIDQKALIDKVLLGFGSKQGPGIAADTLPFYNSTFPPADANLAAAKDLLDKAGYKDTDKDGFVNLPDGKQFTLEILTFNTPASVNLGDLLGNQIKAAGVNVKVTPLAADAHRNKLLAADFDAAVTSLSFGNPDMMFFYYTTSRGVITNGRVVGFNYGGYSNPEYDAKSDAMRNELDDAKRTQAIKDLQVIVAGSFYHLPLYRQDALSLYSTARWQGWVTVPDYGFNNSQTFAALKVK